MTQQVAMIFRLHAFEPVSLANGPGRRAVVWFQGCAARCPGCANPATHDPAAGRPVDTAEVEAWIARAPEITGVSISGGEPFDQPDALHDLICRLRTRNLSILAFTGYAIEEIRSAHLGTEILAALDVLIDGRYDATKPAGRGLLPSSNQRLHLLTARHDPADFSALPACEVRIHRDGTVTITGFRPALERAFAANPTRPAPDRPATLAAVPENPPRQ